MKAKFLFFLKLALLCVGALFIGRVYFFLKYFGLFSSAPASEIVFSFLRGVRFDLSTLAIFIGPFLLLFFLPGVGRNRYLAWTFLAGLLVWLAVLFIYDDIDIQYYEFAQRHLTFELENTVSDTRVVFGIGLSRYFLPFLGLLSFLALFSWAFLRISRDFMERSRQKAAPRRFDAFIYDLTVWVLIVPLLVVAARGGLQSKPLSVRGAFRSESVEMGILSLNGIYTTFNALAESRDGRDPLTYLKTLAPSNGALKKEEVVKKIVLNEKETSDANYPLFRRFHYLPQERRPLNVVLFIMESWSAKFIGALNGRPDATPFFDALAKEGLLLTNCFANAQRSIEGLSATLGSVPVWKGMVLGQGGLLYQTRLSTVGQVFKENGYRTLFVHGARHGSMGFDGLVKRLGFDRHISREDFEINRTTDDGLWGIYDETSFARADQEIRKLAPPFFTTIYSLSSHTPYTLPSKRFERFDPSIPYRDFLNAMGYSDFALGKFFEAAKEAPYFKETLFVLVADHTEGPSTGGDLYEAYHIPCLLYGPAFLAPGRYEPVASQLDILPTVFDLLKISTPYTSWGKSIFSPDDRTAILPRGDFFIYVKAPFMFLTDLESPLGLYNFKENPARNVLEREDPGRTLSNRFEADLRSYLQFSYEVIMGNKVRPPY